MIKFKKLSSKSFELKAEISDKEWIEISLSSAFPEKGYIWCNVCKEDEELKKEFGEQRVLVTPLPFETFEELKEYIERIYGETNLEEFKKEIRRRVKKMKGGRLWR